jgi:predicted component of type VI protein secretion system
MTAVALSWAENGRVRAAPLGPAAPGLIGREAGAAVELADPTVSRRQAVLNERDGRYLIENLSRTNPTRVNDATLQRAAELSDGDRIKAGSVLLFFHDLASHDTIQGPVCSYCHRENKSTDKDCWYCGTSLVNALTLARERRPVTCRVVTATGRWRDLYADQLVPLSSDEALEARSTGDGPDAPADSVAVVIRSGEPRLQVPAESSDVRVNGAAPEHGQRLQTGDDIEVGDVHFTVVVRR